MESNRKKELWEIFDALGIKALTMTHYDLNTEVPSVSKTEWREFLSDNTISQYIKEEMRIVSDAIQKQMIAGIADGGDKSIGRAQIINTLEKINVDSEQKEGPVFIYSYVPLDNQQEQADNVIKLDLDPFKRRLTRDDT